jgi:hypothetical protein
MTTEEVTETLEKLDITPDTTTTDVSETKPSELSEAEEKGEPLETETDEKSADYADTTALALDDEAAKIADKKKGWTPLESNPAVLTTFAHTIGCPSIYSFKDIWSFSEDCFVFIRNPVALVFLFDIKKDVRKPCPTKTLASKKDVFYMKQRTSNACGAFAVMHSLLNVEGLVLDAGSPLDRFRREAEDMDWEERAIAVDNAEYLMTKSESAAKSKAAQTRTPARGEKTEAHFCAYVRKGASIFELDGREDGPYRHQLFSEDGAERDCRPETFLSDCWQVIQSNYNLEATPIFSASVLCEDFPDPAMYGAVGDVGDDGFSAEEMAFLMS